MVGPEKIHRAAHVNRRPTHLRRRLELSAGLGDESLLYLISLTSRSTGSTDGTDGPTNGRLSSIYIYIYIYIYATLWATQTRR